MSFIEEKKTIHSFPRIEMFLNGEAKKGEVFIEKYFSETYSNGAHFFYARNISKSHRLASKKPFRSDESFYSAQQSSSIFESEVNDWTVDIFMVEKGRCNEDRKKPFSG